MTAVETETRPQISTGEGDHDLFAHLVEGGNEVILRSMITGEPVTALCGKVWIPSRDPEKFPVCPDCVRVAAESGAKWTR